MEYLRATDRYLYTLYGGGRGGGKSHIERWRQVRFLLRLTSLGIKNVQAGLFSKNYKVARKRQFLPAKNEFPEWLGTFNESNLEFNFDKKWGGHRLVFGNLADLSDYKSDQFATIGIEELTELPNPTEVIDVLSGSLRWPGVDWTPMGFTTNPDGIGHSQVKGMFVTKTIFAQPDHKDKNPEDFHFVRALPSDNPHLSDHYKNVVLGKLPPALRKPWVEGSWDLFEGQRFFFNPFVHVIDPIPLARLQPCKFYGSADHGFDNPFAYGVYAVLPEGSRPQVYKVYEHNESGLKARQEAKKILEINKALGIRLAEPVFLDTACWKEEDDGKSIAQKFIDEGVEVQQVLKDRATGWEYLDDALFYEADKDDPTKPEDGGEPLFKMFRTCPYTAQQITDALWDPKRPGDIQHGEGFRDDSLDETRYFFLTHFKGPKAPKKDETVNEYHERVQKALERTQRGRRR